MLYDSSARDASYDLIKDWTVDEVSDLRDHVAHDGLQTSFRDTTVLDLAKEVMCITRDGLKRRNRLDFWGQDETHFLATLEQIVDTGMNPAENKIAAFEGRWAGNVDRTFEEYAF